MDFIKSIGNIINKYEEYAKGNDNQHRLFEALIIQGRLIVYKI